MAFEKWSVPSFFIFAWIRIRISLISFTNSKQIVRLAVLWDSVFFCVCFFTPHCHLKIESAVYKTKTKMSCNIRTRVSIDHAALFVSEAWKCSIQICEIGAFYHIVDIRLIAEERQVRLYVFRSKKKKLQVLSPKQSNQNEQPQRFIGPWNKEYFRSQHKA